MLRALTTAMASNPGAVPLPGAKKIEDLRLDNQCLRRLPVDDPEAARYLQQRQVKGACFARVAPTPLSNPKVVAASQRALGELLELSPKEAEREDFAAYFGGNKIIPGAEPSAHCYCGHQFGYYSGQLGDGATMYLGEVVNSRGERWEIQFKGAGKTPFSRTADGRKVLRSSIREFLASEAMHALGVPTTRAGTVVTSDTRVERDIFYTGDTIQERASVVLRIAPSFLRFGSFEIFKATDPQTGRTGPSHGLANELLPTMVNFVVDMYYPHIAAQYPAGSPDALQQRARAFFGELVDRTAELVAGWQSVGWCHGVLNTDNMSIVGVTIDYGPYGFLDRYDPNFICNGSDKEGRYTYAAQPSICKWNLGRLAESLLPVLPAALSAAEVSRYDAVFKRAYMAKMRKKLGMVKELPEDEALVEALFETMEATGADFTNTFRRLAAVPLPESAAAAGVEGPWVGVFMGEVLRGCAGTAEMARASMPRVRPEQLQMLQELATSNPRMLEQIGLSVEFVQQEVSRAERFVRLQRTGAEAKAAADRASWQEWAARYRARLAKELEGPSALSEEARQTMMSTANPKYILRNYIADNAIAAAEQGDYSEVQRVLQRLEDPYGLTDAEAGVASTAEPALVSPATQPATPGAERGAAARKPADVKSRILPYDSLPPQWANELCVT